MADVSNALVGTQVSLPWALSSGTCFPYVPGAPVPPMMEMALISLL